MNAYEELKERHRKELNEFPLGFAFSKEQFKRMMEKWGLTENDTDKIYSIGAGGYVRRLDADAMHELIERHQHERKQAIENDVNGDGYIYQMFRSELANHEYGYTGDIEETLDAVGVTLDDLNKHENLRKGLAKALKTYEYDD